MRLHACCCGLANFAKTTLVLLTLSNLLSNASLGQSSSNTLIQPRINPFRDLPQPSATAGTDVRSELGVNAREGRVASDVIRLGKLPQNLEPPVVTAISVSPDGTRLAAAGDDHAIRIVDMATGKTLTTLSGHLDWVQCVEYSPSGRLLATGGNDRSLRLWSMEGEPKLIAQFSVDQALQTLAFVDDDRIFAAGFGQNIYTWTTGDNRLTVDHVCECRDIRSIVISPDRKWLAYGGRDGVLRVRNIDGKPNKREEQGPLASAHAAHADGTQEIAVPLHFDRIRSIQFSSDGQRITSVGEDRRIVHYDLLGRKTIGKTEIGGGKLMGLCQLEPNLFAIAGSDNSIRIFNELDQQVLVKLIGHDGSVSILKKTANQIVSGSFDTTIRVWDIDQALSNARQAGKYVHPVAAQFEDSGAGDAIK
jgi:WD40 repeat protein